MRGAEKADRGLLSDNQAKLAKLNEVLRQPVLKKELFQNTVIIESVELATEWRERRLEETVDRIKQAVAEYDAKALKIKVLRYVI